MTDWKRVNPFCIQRDGWFISKAFSEGATLYQLFDTAGVRYGHFDSADEAKAAVVAMEKAAEE